MMCNRSLLWLLFVPLLAAARFGPSETVLERVWVVQGTPGTAYTLDGILAVNDSSQHVYFTELPNNAEVIAFPDGVLRLRYAGTLSSPRDEVRAVMRIYVLRDTRLTADVVMPSQSLPPTSLTVYDRAMQQQARSLVVPDSTLQTLVQMVEWVHNTVEYDTTYWGASEPAETVFADRRGVCVEYSHLLIALLRSVGLETRYVSGYVQAEGWQPHAWVQVNVPSYGWLDADATFNQLGVVDNSHIAMYHGSDQSEVFDSITSVAPLRLSTDERIRSHDGSPRNPQDVAMFFISNRSTGNITVRLTNPTSEYRYVNFFLRLPSRYGANTNRILLLPPGGERQLDFGSAQPFDTGYIYHLPFVARANDVLLQSDFIIERKEEPFAPTVSPLPECLPLFLLLFIGIHIRGVRA